MESQVFLPVGTLRPGGIGDISIILVVSEKMKKTSPDGAIF